MKRLLLLTTTLFFSNAIYAGQVSDGGSFTHMAFMKAANSILKVLEKSEDGRQYSLDKGINVSKIRSFLHADRVISTKQKLIDVDGDPVDAKISTRTFCVSKKGEIIPIKRAISCDRIPGHFVQIGLNVVLYNIDSWSREYQPEAPHWIYPLVLKELIRITGEYRETTIEQTANGILSFFINRHEGIANGELCARASQCSSGYCYPGPEGATYCISEDSNCAKPSSIGIFFGQSYTFEGQTYKCQPGVGLILQ